MSVITLRTHKQKFIGSLSCRSNFLREKAAGRPPFASRPRGGEYQRLPEAPVFLPAAGNRNGSSLNNVGSNGNYWSSTPNSSNSDNAYNLNFNSGNVNPANNNNRNNGQSVRLVSVAQPFCSVLMP